MNLKPDVIEYNGIEFDNRLDAKWAMFFSYCGADWKYKPARFKMYSADLADLTINKDGCCEGYLPKFLVWNVEGCVDEELFVDVYSYMHPLHIKIVEGYAKKLIFNGKSGIYVVGDIPVRNPHNFIHDMGLIGSEHHHGVITPPYYTTETTTYMGYGAGYFGVRHDGKPCLFDEQTFPEMDWRKTCLAFRAVLDAQFELLNEPFKEGYARLKMTTDMTCPQSQGQIAREEVQKKLKEINERSASERIQHEGHTVSPEQEDEV